MSILTTEPVRPVLDRLFAAEKSDYEIIQKIAEKRSNLGSGGTRKTLHDLPPQELSDLLSGVSIPVSRETGELLYILARGRDTRRIVEFGTSHGVSTIYLAAAVRDNGGGQVIGTELQENKVRTASANLAEVGLDDLVEIRHGDARDTLRELPGPVDLLLVDGFASLYLDVLRLVEPYLRPGALVVADGMPEGPDVLGDYLEYVRDPANGYTSINLALGDGIELSLRVVGSAVTTKERWPGGNLG